MTIAPRPYPTLSRILNGTDGLCYPFRETTNGEHRNHLVLYEDSTSGERRLIKMQHEIRDRHILCCVKRVYGGVFSGYPESANDIETSILDAFVEEASKCCFIPSKRIPARREQLHRSSDRIVSMLKGMFQHEVKVHLDKIGELLLDQNTALSWAKFKNNCQELADRLLRGADFDYVFPSPAKDSSMSNATGRATQRARPTYLISFGDRVEGKYMTVNQLKSITERFCETGHAGNDIIDLLQEELSVKMNGTLNNFFEHCSELALITPPPINHDSNHSQTYDALWNLPRDTLSVLQCHLLRPPSKYKTTSGNSFDSKQWLQGRIRLLRQLSVFASFTGGLGTALQAMVSTRPDMISRAQIPKSRIFGSLSADERVKIISFRDTAILYVIAGRSSQQFPTTRYGIPKALLNDWQTRIDRIKRAKGQVTKLQIVGAGLKGYAAAAVDLLRRRKLLPPSAFIARQADESILRNPLNYVIEPYWAQMRDGWVYFGFRDATFAYQQK